MNKTPLLVFTWLIGLALLAPRLALAQTLFSDNFDTDTAANWSVFEGSGNGVSDFNARFAYDYGTNRYTINGVTNFIPSAPNSAGGTTRALRLTVNKNDAVAATAAVSAYPKNQIFSNDYSLRFDMWINYNGSAFGGAGSTEFATFGVNHIGDRVNWTLNNPSDGVWFTVDGEAGANGDYRAYVGDPASTAVRLTGIDAFLDRNGDGIYEEDVAAVASPFKLIFPAPLFETAGVPGKRWVQVEVRQQGGLVKWLIDGYVIAEHSNGSAVGFTAGDIMLGYMDIFSSIANPREDNYVLYDNVRVVNLATNTPLPVISVIASDLDASEPGSDTGIITVSRSGDTAGPLTINLRISGTASNGFDMATVPGSVTLSTGQDQTNLVIQPIDDSFGEVPETVIVTAAGNTNYDVQAAISATVTISDNNDLASVSLASVDTNSYERVASDFIRFDLIRAGDSSTDLSVNIGISGSASNGVDYSSIPPTVTIPAGSTNVSVLITPTNDTLVEGSETIFLTLRAGSKYTLGLITNRSATVLDDDRGAETNVVFSETFETEASGANWKTLFGSAVDVADAQVLFGYDYSLEGIPPAPKSTNGTTRGVKILVNKDATDAAAAINLYPIGQTFSGDFIVRFDMLMSVGTDAAGTSEHAIFGVNHSGNITNRHGVSPSDGLWYAILGDGSNNRGLSSYASVNGTFNQNVVSLNNVPDFENVFSAPPWGYDGSPSVLTNAVTLAGSEKIWGDVEIRNEGGVVTMRINNTPIFTRTNDTGFTSGTLMLGHNDQFNSTGSTNTYTLFDNVRVLQLSAVVPSAPPVITNIRLNGSNVEVSFVGSPGDSAASFSLVASPNLNQPITWSNTGATITGTSPNFVATTPMVQGENRFYRVRRN